MAILKTRAHWTKGAEIAKNSLDIKEGRLVAIKAGFADVAVAGDRVVGISKQTKVFEPDNQTVLQEKLTYNGLDEFGEFDELVSGGTISQADVQTDFDLTSDGFVDGTTGGTGSQVRLTKVISDTKGRFIAL